MCNNRFLLICSLLFLTALSACGGGSNSDSVPAPVTPSPTVTLSASSESVEINSEFTLTWSSTDANTCSTSGNWSGDKTISGSEAITEVQIATKVYKISCSGTGGQVSASVEVEITPLSNTGQWDYYRIPYSTDDPNRQWLNIHLAYDQSKTSPIYLFAHGNGGSADGVIENELNAIASEGYAIISWESIPTISSPEEAEIGVADAQVVFDWVIANADTYNLDSNHIVIGGRSRGSIISWQLAHSNHPSIKGIYMYNALPQPAWQDTDTWSPEDEITINSPNAYLVYGPDFDDDDIHNPVNVDPVLARYGDLGIGDKISRYVDMWRDFRSNNGGWTNDAHTMHYFPEFVASLNGNDPILTVNRTIKQIKLIESRTLNMNGSSFELNFYRNEAYTCGLSGNYTFVVMEPADNTGVEAPLWAYLHGGGYGWFDEDQIYQAVKTMTQDTFNHEETFDDLIDDHLLHNTMRNGEVMDSTLTRRIQEGYRVLLVSMCDHDNYSGRGTPYPNNPNPNGGERQVNGLQGTMAAMDYTVANYPTSHVFAHGTSAGSIGAFAMSHAYAEEGTYLTAIVADSWQYTRRTFDMFDALVGQEGYVWNEGSDLRTDGMDKIGFDYLGLGIFPEAVIEGGFVEVPSMYIIGEKDPGCGGYRDGILPTILEAEAEGLSNCGWQYDGLREAIENQPDSPHLFDLSPSGDHVETNRENPVNNRVNNFINDTLATNPPYPFAGNPNVIVGDKMMLMGHSFFRPFADQMPHHAQRAGVDGHSQNVEFSGGESGTPLSLWEDAEHRANVQAVLDSGDVDVFGMTCCDWELTPEGERELDSEGNPILSLEGWQIWFDYALAQNSDTEFFIGIPWIDYPTDYVDAEAYADMWYLFYNTMVLPAVDDLRALYPGVTIYTIPYGDGVNELRKMFETGNLPDITNLEGLSDTSLFTDYKGHGGQLLKDLVEYIWIDAIYGVDLETYDYDDGYQTDLKALAKSIMDAHDPNYNGPNRK